MTHNRKGKWFDRAAKKTSFAAGHPATFVISAAAVAVWLAIGPVFRFSDTWQLWLNTVASVAAFLMVFLIQNTQNRGAAAVQLKLDELIRAVDGAHNALMDLEELSQDDLEKLQNRYQSLAAAARDKLRRGEPDTDSPTVHTQ